MSRIRIGCVALAIFLSAAPAPADKAAPLSALAKMPVKEIGEQAGPRLRGVCRQARLGMASRSSPT